jgi:hypothetical protein
MRKSSAKHHRPAEAAGQARFVTVTNDARPGGRDWSGGLCHGNEGGTHREPKLAKHHAAVTALFHCAAASVRNFRSVDRETRWR